jgi:uncharacterized membrane protein
MIRASDKEVNRLACATGICSWFPIRSWAAIGLGVSELIGSIMLCFYILSFAGYKSSQDAMNILETIGASQASTLFLTAPLVQLVLLLLSLFKKPGLVQRHYQKFLNDQAAKIAVASFGTKDVRVYLDNVAYETESCKELDKLYAILFKS